MKTSKIQVSLFVALIAVFLSGCVTYVFTTPTEVAKSVFKKKSNVLTSTDIMAKDGSRVYFLELKIPLKNLHRAEGPEQIFTPVVSRSSYDTNKPCRYRIFEQKIINGEKTEKPSIIVEWRIKHNYWFLYDIHNLFFDPIANISRSNVKNASIAYQVKGKKVEREEFLTVLREEILSQVDFDQNKKESRQ